MTTRNEPPAENSWAVRLNRWALGWSRHYLTILLTIIGIFVTLPFVAPALMKVGATGPANLIYSAYSPLCHRLSFRSWFLFGEQAAYPRESAGVPGLRTYESYLMQVDATLGDRPTYPPGTVFGQLEADAQSFIGNEQMGYKVAICQRDVAIYWGLFLGGAVFAIPQVRRTLRPAPFWLFILLGLGPIGVDGVSQLFSAVGAWPVRETTPAFRTITGALFGLMTAWLAFPYLEANARDVRQELEKKFTRRARRGAAKNLQEQIEP